MTLRAAQDRRFAITGPSFAAGCLVSRKTALPFREGFLHEGGSALCVSGGDFGRRKNDRFGKNLENCP